MSAALPPDAEDDPRHITATSPALLSCPACKQPYQPDEVICSHCGTSLIRNGQTGYLSLPIEPLEPGREPRGDAFINRQRPISLHVKTHMLMLPPVESLIIGRYSDSTSDAQPDVDLDPLGAKEAGVSRRHIQITHRKDMVYVSDLGSSNGTWLNGHRLFAHTARLLRSGDELRLGTLKITVTF
jgi:hypothetical protein